MSEKKSVLMSRRTLIIVGVPVIVAATGWPILSKILKKKFLVRVPVFIKADNEAEYEIKTAKLLGSDLTKSYSQFIQNALEANKILKRRVHLANGAWESMIIFHQEADAKAFIDVVNPLLSHLQSQGIKTGEMTITEVAASQLSKWDDNRNSLPGEPASENQADSKD